MKKAILFLLVSLLCLSLLCGCGNSKPIAKSETDSASPLSTTGEAIPNYVLISNSDKATMNADKEFKTVIQITNSYPDEIVCVFDDPEIADCEWVQWVGTKGALMFTGLKKGETTLTVYAGVKGDDIKTAQASVSVHVVVEDDPS